MRCLPLLLLLGAAPAASLAAPAPSLDEAIRRVDAAQKDVRTLDAEFVQKNRVRLFKQELVSKGRLLYQRGAPSQLRWEYLSPDPSTMILSGKQAFLVMPGQKTQVFNTEGDSTLRAIFAELELWLGNGSLRAAGDQYEMSLGAGAIILFPRDKSPLSRAFSRIEMRLDEATMLLKGLLLIEKGGDQKEILFTRMRRNVPLPAAAFKP